MWGVRQTGAALAIVLGVLAGELPAVAQEARLKQAAQHFADLEDDQARALLEELSGEGVADADVLLGYLYSDPLLDGRDYEKAISYFKRAAEKDHAEAVFQLAESHYWLGYLGPRPGVPPQMFGARNDESYELLERAVAKGHGGARIRLALLCLFQAYACSRDQIEEAFKLNRIHLRADFNRVTDAFYILDLWQNEPETFERSEKVFNRYRLGLSELNPLVISLFDSGWPHFASRERCPGLHDPHPMLRLFLRMNGLAAPYEKSVRLEDCFGEEEINILNEKVFGWIDSVVTHYGNASLPYASWCYETYEWEEAKQCLVTSMIDHYVACFRISLGDFVDTYDIDYVKTNRYSRCREHLLAVRWQ